MRVSRQSFDYLIVGAGVGGCVLAERLGSIGKKVLLIDKRDHIAGNAFDYHDDHGVLIHKYGPHYFRTNFPEVREYLSQFTDWIEQRYVIKSCVGGELYDFPINRRTLNRFFGQDLKTEEDVKAFLDGVRDKSIGIPKNAEEQVLKLVGRKIYDAFFKEYTKKQWGTDAADLDPTVTARIPLRYNEDEAYLNDSFQAMPKEGYTRMFEGMVKGNRNITILLNAGYAQVKDRVKFKKLIYTGPIDEYFGYKHGRLKYRSLRFEHRSFSNQEYHQKYSQINYPGKEPYTRVVEIKHATRQKCPNTTIVYEYPTWDGDPYYPYPTQEERDRYAKYREDAKSLKDVHFIGRLAIYSYLNMDQVVKQALLLFESLKKEEGIA